MSIDAIVPDTETGNEKWLEINKKYSEIWPNISQKKIHQQITKNIKMKKINLKNILKKTFKKKNLKKQKKKKNSKKKKIKKIRKNYFKN